MRAAVIMVRFSDFPGAPFTSADAKATVDRVRFPARGLVIAIGNYFEAIEKTETPDPGTLVIKLRNRFAPHISFLAMGQMIVMKKEVVDRLGGSKLNKIPDAIGTGPFKLQEWSPGVGWLVVKNKDYWKKGQPYLDGVRHFLLVDRAARIHYNSPVAPVARVRLEPKRPIPALLTVEGVKV